MALNLRWLLWPRPHEEDDGGNCVQDFRRFLRGLTIREHNHPERVLDQLRGLRSELDTLIGFLEQEQEDRKTEPERRRRLFVKCAEAMGKEPPCA